jgi:hypothetical protein
VHWCAKLFISVLGGGTAVNSALWWKPHPSDWDIFPAGWKNDDMKALVDKVWLWIPGVSRRNFDAPVDLACANALPRHTPRPKIGSSTSSKALTPSPKAWTQLASSTSFPMTIRTRRIAHTATARSSSRTPSAMDPWQPTLLVQRSRKDSICIRTPMLEDSYGLVAISPVLSSSVPKEAL